ncbi:MAG: Gfo/Idh/MocA family protein [Anaerolineae bacterium]
MERALRVGIVGLGAQGLLHLDVLSHMPGVEVAAVCSRSQERAAEVARRYAVSGVFTDAAAMAEHVSLDALYVCTEDDRHLEPTLAALHAGMHVFVEKPISVDLEEARRMVSEAERLERRLMVGHVVRFDPRYAIIKERIQSGAMGRVATVYGRRNQSRALLDRYCHASRIFTTGIHDIDVILWYYEGHRPVEVYMKTESVHGKGDDVFWGMMTMDDGSLGIVETAWILPESVPWGRQFSLQVMGSEAVASVETPGSGLALWSGEGSDAADFLYWPMVHGTVGGALRDEDAYFIRCLREDLPIEMPRPQDAIRSLEVAHAFLQSAATGRPVRLA